MKTLLAIIVTAIIVWLIAGSQKVEYRALDLCATPTPTETVLPTDTPTALPTFTVLPSATPTSVLPTATPTAFTPLPKKGVAFTGPGYQETFNPSVVGAGWFYSYQAQNTGLQPSFVPMVRSTTSAAMIQWMARRLQSKYVLVFNEPNRSDQDNITPQQGATIYHAIYEQVMIWDTGAKFILGNVSTIDYYGYSWLRDMVLSYQSQYGTMPYAGWGVHIYDCVSSQQVWRDKLQMFVNWRNADGYGGKELWVTEMGCLNNDATAQRIVNEQTYWLNNETALVNRTAWFATRNDAGSGSLLWPAGNLTPLGASYYSK